MRDKSESKISPKVVTGMKKNVFFFVVEINMKHLNTCIEYKSGAQKKCLVINLRVSKIEKTMEGMCLWMKLPRESV